MGTKNEIKVVSKELTKYRVFLTTTIEIEVDVYAEDAYEARQIAEQELSITEYSNDTIGVEIPNSWSQDITRDGDQKMELVSVSAGGYVEAYNSESEGSITLYAREEDGFDDTDKIFIDEDELIDYYTDDEDEEDEDQ
jgi:hypothetical protein